MNISSLNDSLTSEEVINIAESVNSLISDPRNLQSNEVGLCKILILLPVLLVNVIFRDCRTVQCTGSATCSVSTLRGTLNLFFFQRYLRTVLVDVVYMS